ncbi:hypothetical protein A3B21_02875 [Candidatus Uhrbacteria bacterium RIFCSPLOWO2_01_FULL_47_24]|uniref:50S ribosomal protein L7/L12 n=1 Tax=Candidatus Uhrbacteria bacterium RIFCSPLOWO2_01_FULL_47_24 TaxID=1802401 RepID=A0A1F7UU26_9BACT|nr:MAG: hypothetical protein A2753_03705 [Candidatus Uhrbacteria bacterium RIFCSPHIGHO2_01_FULL_47_11]OGL68641.1 MAG: hypothetical protein A3D58_01905 [Candidatus Uhrbacteria bacterium RIFCSPHIGHO2_02_FULL_46_47]OGL76297.1 MAG: hypothetical protein A3F52_03320 [Candidatus Uhrbacteria bacterium RIFCSPHIGHO2_12_FULL_47_11]OGL81208.1 MAG: hypothetical protein A3B21_02875 [Candidatus Uhrbacteria bacterium RIFCSPLOWO2_01_FULL_47_24]OGL84628.1 MAG: hypothetical protein A3J03_02380 [Candidatus Uhrbact
MPNKNDELALQLAEFRKKIDAAQKMMEQGDVEQAEAFIADLRAHSHATQPTPVPDGSRIIEGVFDGQRMIGADGKQYLVPPNYASKSKLVEGDMMKLSITLQGAFIYKQIGPIERKRVACTLTKDGEGLWHATDGVHEWRLLTAAVTFFKGKAGDEVIIFLPGDAPSKWAAVENIIAK